MVVVRISSFSILRFGSCCGGDIIMMLVATLQLCNLAKFWIFGTEQVAQDKEPGAETDSLIYFFPRKNNDEGRHERPTTAAPDSFAHMPRVRSMFVSYC